MKILAIIGSPKGRGAGYNAVRRIEEEMRALGEVEFDYLFLKDLDLRPCRGCFLCVRKGEDRCPISDQRTEIEKRIEAVDGIILSSPCYVFNMSTLMKNLTDRLCYINHRPRFFRQKLMLVANASSGMEETIRVMRHTLGPGPEVVKELSLLTPPWPLSDSVEVKQSRSLAEAARTMFQAIRRDEARGGLPGKPGFSDYLRFRFFKKVSKDAADYLPADYAYYREMEDYYYRTRVNPVHRLVAGALLKVSAITMRDLAPAHRT